MIQKVPLGAPSLFINTTALESNFIDEPLSRCKFLDVLTMTALVISDLRIGKLGKASKKYMGTFVNIKKGELPYYINKKNLLISCLLYYTQFYNYNYNITNRSFLST